VFLGRLLIVGQSRIADSDVASPGMVSRSAQPTRQDRGSKQGR